MKLVNTVLILILLISSKILCQVTLVKDINKHPFSSLPKEITQVGNVVFFICSTLNKEMELWRSNGTNEGTYKVKTISSSFSYSDASLTNVNGVLFLKNDDGVNGLELWKSDGTEEGTVMVKDIFQGTDSSYPDNLTNVNGVLYFIANNGVNGIELWKSDGTTSGTTIVKDIYPGSGSSHPNYLTSVNGKLYFSAYDEANGIELWKSDGSAAETFMVKDIFSGPYSSSNPSNLTNVNGVLHFTADDGANGIELWKSNGTSLGTVVVKDIEPGLGSSNPCNLTSINGILFFSAVVGLKGSELWKSNGTGTGTLLVKDINSGSGSSSPNSLTNVNGMLYFTANDGVNGSELWKSNGTETGTIIVKNICPESGSSNPNYLTNVNGLLFFIAYDGVSGIELWKSDGTDAGTILVKDIRAGKIPSVPSNLTNVNGVLYFNSDDGVNGTELFKSDGTNEGTIMVKDIGSGSVSSEPHDLMNVDGTLHFSAYYNAQNPSWYNYYKINGLYISDGTEAGTVSLKEFPDNPSRGSTNLSQFINANGMLFFKASFYIYEYIYKSDGTSDGTTLIRAFGDYGQPSQPVGDLMNVNQLLYFGAYRGSSIGGYGLWKTDGTELGTVVVKVISSSNPRNLTHVNGILYFVANDGVNGTELWKSDGTAAGTIMVKDINSGSGSSSPNSLTNVNGMLYFTANDGVNGAELWKSDGTASGTVMVKDIGTGSVSSEPTNLTAINGKLYFTAFNEIIGEELWKSDGTTSGTVLIKDIYPGSGSSNTNYITYVNGFVYFSSDDGMNGTELWKSDGTSTGTVLVKDITAGSQSGSPRNLIAFKDKLYFSAKDDFGIDKLWGSDGTDTGTEIAFNGDLIVSSNPNFTPINNNLFFVGSINNVGDELLKYSPVPVQPDIISGNTMVCQGSTVNYTIPPVKGATSYTWTLPPGWSGSSATTSISAIPGINGGTISVVANNSYGSSVSRTFDVTVKALPIQPGTISGNIAVCQGSSVTYSIPSVPGATFYTWTLPSGWTGSSTSTSISASPGINGGTISVAANNSCGTSTSQTLSVTVKVLPSRPGTISGNTIVCQGSSVTYSISPVTEATSYIWTLPSGWGGSSASTSISVIPGITGGSISVVSNNSCGISASRTLTIVMASKPSVVTTNISEATSATAIAGGNITSDGGADIIERGVCWSTTINPTISDSKTSDGASEGSFNSTITGLTNGVSYHIRAYATNCSGTSYGSDITYFHNTTDIDETQCEKIRIYPNPVTGILNIDYKEGVYETIRIFNSQGVLVKDQKVITPLQRLDFSGFEKGLYIIEFVKSTGQRERVKIINQ